jgi:alpha-tubulin suppressor-like RCC1 family protein
VTLRPALLLLATASAGCGVFGSATTEPNPEPREPDRAVSLAASEQATCAVTQHGEVWCWGDDCHGAPVDGLRSLVCSVPSRVPGIRDATALALGNWGSKDVVLHRDGRVSQGHGSDGFTWVAIDRARAIANAGSFACALLESGEVACWDLGNDHTATLVPGPTDVITLVARQHLACALDASGTSWCWTSEQTSAIEPTTLAPASVLALGHAHDYIDLGLRRLPNRPRPSLQSEGGHACMRTREGVVRCWGGSNRFGELAQPSCAEQACDTALESAPALELGDVVSFALGLAHSCALDRAGQVQCWGASGWAQLGDGEGTHERARPDRIHGTRAFVEMVAGYHHTCARTAEGAVYCWGRNDGGQVGVGDRSDYYSSPQRVAGLGQP